MNILTSQQKRVLNGIKYFSAEYHGGVPYKILKLDLDTTEEDLNPILEYLEKGNYISLQDGIIRLEKNRDRDEGGVVQGEAQSKDTPSEDTSKVTLPEDSKVTSSEDSSKVTSSKDTSKGTVEKKRLPDSDQWALDNALTLDNEDVGIGTQDVENRDDNDQPESGVETPEGIVEIEKVLPKEGEVNLSNDNHSNNSKTDVDDELTDAAEEGVEVELEEQFSEKELKAVELIQKVVDESGNISRTLLEGTFLYGELELSSISMYNLVTSLENKGIIKKIKLTDGEYYRFTP
ncbi:MAG: hypothetical protein KO318_01920 [Methanobacterium sp.]|jgi:hypothetical protein|uniref:hypothetical protein n=1 Tax=Methanobacterium sp. TaxID=2164 RepID=UPI0025840E5C|nr:hypothetical protein [Methanobacterium sp.]MCC7559180.1 hypothetical protein [Methanobacterium sp.]